jgi:hypothetical protein
MLRSLHNANIRPRRDRTPTVSRIKISLHLTSHRSVCAAQPHHGEAGSAVKASLHMFYGGVDHDVTNVEEARR